MHFLNESNIAMAFVQEPYCHRGNISFCPNSFVTFLVDSQDNSRAGIVLTKQLADKAILISKYTSRDQIVLQLNFSRYQTYWVSSYLLSDWNVEDDIGEFQKFLWNDRPTNIIRAWILIVNIVHGIVLLMIGGVKYLNS